MDHSFSIADILMIIAPIGSVLGIFGYMRRTRRENDADARARTDELKQEIKTHHDSVEKRLVTLEGKSADFMPRFEIENKIDHEKNNRITADNALKDRLDRGERDIVDIKVSVGRLEQKHDSAAGEIAEIKALLKEQGRDIGSRLDKITDQLAHQRAA